MILRRFVRVLAVLFAFILLSVSILLVFALAAHVGCTVNDCIPCLSHAKSQGIFRQLGGTSNAALSALTLLTILLFAAGEVLFKPNTSNLVALKMRLNN